jgi:ribosomal protein S18 acetylase RimI-like enzyme
MGHADASSIRIRPCQPDDWGRVAELLHAVFAGEGYTSPEQAAKAYTPQNLSANGVMLVAEDSTGIVGSVLLLSPGDKLAQLADAGEMEFRLLAVAPHCRGKRVGAHLVQACIDRASEPPMRAQRLVICTQPSMHAAQRLYEQLGFVRVPHRNFTIAPTDDTPAQDRLVYTYALRESLDASR